MAAQMAMPDRALEINAAVRVVRPRRIPAYSPAAVSGTMPISLPAHSISKPRNRASWAQELGGRFQKRSAVLGGTLIRSSRKATQACRQSCPA
jgi:hypothetical protein